MKVTRWICPQMAASHDVPWCRWVRPARAAVLACAVVATAACGRRETATVPGDAELFTVARRPLSSSVAALGAVKPQVGAEVKVGARISGRVQRLHANIKDQVRKGQVIAELEKADLEALVAESAAEARFAEAKRTALDELYPRDVARAETDVARWEATVALARKDLDRQHALLARTIASQIEVDRAREALAVSEAQLLAAREALELVRVQHAENVKQAQAELERDRAALANAEVQLSYALIRAPISGVVGSVSTQEGETVAAGLNAPTFVTIIDLGRLQVEAYVDEVDIGKIKVEQRAVFTVDAFPADDFTGRVMAIYPKATIQDNVVKYVVAIDIVSPYEGRLRPEMTTNVTILLDVRQVLAIPSSAVRREGGRHYVMVWEKNGAVRREVRLGWKDGAWTEVAEGLAEGQQILVEGLGAEKGMP